jgi:hypothetical protein
MINFRPWLLTKFQRTTETGGEMFTKQELLKIAKARDLYHFGESLFDLMVGKTSKEDLVKQVMIDEHNKSMHSTGSNNNKQRKLNLPQLDSIPLSWMKRMEGACLIEILHMCMVIDTDRDT